MIQELHVIDDLTYLPDKHTDIMKDTQNYGRCGFCPSEIIEDSKKLFGRNKPGQLLEQLLTSLQLGTNVQVIGERRSGKTSLFKCVENDILDTLEHSRILPIYLNFKEYSFVKGNINVFRFILSKCIEFLTQKGFYNSVQSFKSIEPELEWESAYEHLMDMPNYRIQGLLTNYLRWNAKNLKKGFVFLIDEYEYLFINSFDERGGFFPLRNLSSESSENQVKTLTVAITGKVRWDKLCTQIGSPELNNIGRILYISPLEFSDFTDLWLFLLSRITTPAHQILKKTELIYDYSGGIPFYAKVIGEHLLTSGMQINFDILQPYFEEIFQRVQMNLEGKKEWT